MGVMVSYTILLLLLSHPAGVSDREYTYFTWQIREKNSIFYDRVDIILPNTFVYYVGRQERPGQDDR